MVALVSDIEVGVLLFGQACVVLKHSIAGLQHVVGGVEGQKVAHLGRVGWRPGSIQDVLVAKDVRSDMLGLSAD